MAIIKGKPTKDGRQYSFKVRYTTLDGTTKQYLSKKYSLKKEAQEAERQFLLTLTNKTEYSNINFHDLFLSYDSFQKDRLKITSYNDYKKFLKYFESLYKVKVLDFDLVRFNQWKNSINKLDLSTTYKNNIFKFLKALLHYANKYLDLNTISISNKLTGFKNPNELKKEMKFYTYDEFKDFIKQEKDIKYKCFFETLYYCGLRKGEANALTWNDINFEKNTLSISKNLTRKIKGEKYVILPPKTKSSIRILPMPKCLLDDIKMLYNEYSKYDNFEKNWFVFGGIYPLADTSIQVHSDRNCKLGNVKHIRIHDFRHSCASLLINNGSSITLVAKYLGHSNISTTLNTYTHMFKNEFDDIINTINNLK